LERLILGASAASNSVYFVYEDDAWSMSLGSCEEVTYAPGTHTNIHLIEL
jgi:hypothetical protein